jgi:Ca2+-binding RTX toxin-like protein
VVSTPDQAPPALETPNLIKGSYRADWLYGNDGRDEVYGYGGRDVVYGGDGVDKVLAGQGDDRLYGEAGDDRLFGYTGNDRIFGGTGNDSLVGQAGNDRLIGGLGDDTLTGGTGNDRYYFTNLASIDTITDFDVAHDKIYLSSTVFGWLDGDATDRILYDPETGELSFDVDGNGGVDAVVFARLGTYLNLTAENFWIY